MVGHTLIAIVDNIMVGKLGSTEPAAVSLGNSLIFVAMSLGIGFSTAITPIIAEADAEKTAVKYDWLSTTVVFMYYFRFRLFGLVVIAKPVMELQQLK